MSWLGNWKPMYKEKRFDLKIIQSNQTSELKNNNEFIFWPGILCLEILFWILQTLILICLSLHLW